MGTISSGGIMRQNAKQRSLQPRRCATPSVLPILLLVPAEVCRPVLSTVFKCISLGVLSLGQSWLQQLGDEAHWNDVYAVDACGWLTLTKLVACKGGLV